MTIIEGEIQKGCFESFPTKIEEGSCFGIVKYLEKDSNQTKIGAWPLERYWNKDLLKD